jgi:hypothetical protein
VLVGLLIIEFLVVIAAVVFVALLFVIAVVLMVIFIFFIAVIIYGIITLILFGLLMACHFSNLDLVLVLLFFVILVGLLLGKILVYLIYN